MSGKETHIAGKVQHFDQLVPFIRAPDWWHPCVGNKANAQILLKFGGHAKHQSGVVPHGSAKEPVIKPPTWFEPCEGGVRVGTRHVQSVKFGAPQSSDKLLSMAKKAHSKAVTELAKKSPNKNVVQKHLAHANQCLSTVTLIR